MNEQDYERFVERLVQRWDNRLLEIALSVPERESAEEFVEESTDAVELALFHHGDWERVQAVDISDIAAEYAEKAWSQRRAWERS